MKPPILIFVACGLALTTTASASGPATPEQKHLQPNAPRTVTISVSRASHDAQIYANDAASLAGKLSQDVSKSAAVSFGNAQSTSMQQGLALAVR